MTTSARARAFLQSYWLSSVLSGIGLGIGARVVMRIVAWSSGLAGSFSLGGSRDVVLFGVLIGTPFALLFFAARERFAWPRAWSGRLAGGTLFAFLAFIPPGSARSALAATPEPPLQTALLFAVLFVLFGWTLEHGDANSTTEALTRKQEASMGNNEFLS